MGSNDWFNVSVKPSNANTDYLCYKKAEKKPFSMDSLLFSFGGLLELDKLVKQEPEASVPESAKPAVTKPNTMAAGTKVKFKKVTIDNENGKIVKRAYDDNNRLIAVYEEYTDENGVKISELINYHENGKIKSMYKEEKGEGKENTSYSLYYENGIAREIEVNENGKVRSSFYNKEGKCIEQKDDEETISYLYDKEGKLLSCTTSYKNGKTSSILYDKEGNPLTLTITENGKTVCYNYDNEGKPIKEAEGKDNQTEPETLLADANKDEEQLSEDADKEEQVEYDTTTEKDKFGRKITKTVSKDGTTTIERVEDSDGSYTENTTVKNPDGTVTKTTEMSMFGQITKKVTTIDKNGNKTSNMYDNDGTKYTYKSYTDESGTKVSEQTLYDKKGKVKEIIISDNEGSFATSFDERGNKTEESTTCKNGESVTYSYDKNGRVTQRKDKSSNGLSTVTQYDENGNVTTYKEDMDYFSGITRYQSGEVNENGEFSPDNNGDILRLADGTEVNTNDLVQCTNNFANIDISGINFNEVPVSEEVLPDGNSERRFSVEKDGMEISRIDCYDANGDFTGSMLVQRGENFERTIPGSFNENGEFTPSEDNKGTIIVGNNVINVEQLTTYLANTNGGKVQRTDVKGSLLGSVLGNINNIINSL